MRLESVNVSTSLSAAADREMWILGLKVNGEDNLFSK